MGREREGEKKQTEKEGDKNSTIVEIQYTSQWCEPAVNQDLIRRGQRATAGFCPSDLGSDPVNGNSAGVKRQSELTSNQRE